MSGGKALATALLALSAARGAAPSPDESRGFDKLERIWTQEKQALESRPAVLAMDAGGRWKVLVARVRERAHAELKDDEYPNLTPAQFGDLGERLAGDASKLARSVEAAATNPAAVGLVERSGLIDKLALTLQGQKLLSADETAVTLNLNALALLGRPEQGPVRPGLSRLGGSVTFGAKLPQKEIVGFSGLPDADKLLDALSWDLKLRLWGDRDPRAREWARYQWADTAMLQLDAIAPADLAAVRSAIQELGNAQVERAIGRSTQASLKFAGQHLTREAGLNKYSGSLLVDVGLGLADFTLNATYSAAQDVKLANGLPVTLKQWKLAAGLSATLARDLLVEGRGTELTVSGEALLPWDGNSVPLDRKTTWKADASLKLPITDTTQVPISVTWTNDPNNLTKSKYVRGQMGISYDFKSLVQLAKGHDKPDRAAAGGGR